MYKRQGELEKPWREQKHDILAVNSGKFRQAQVEWHINCKEAYPIRRAVEKHRHLLLGDVPFVSVNDHRTLKYIFNEPARTAAISVAARDRLRRWVQYLRSYVFHTVHIPGDENHFCDLLSRHGCTVAAKIWKSQPRNELKVKAKPQMAIITPAPIPQTGAVSHKDMDVDGRDLMMATNKND